jgi:hypothetical protein
MAITQISQIQVRRGLNQDLPQLASGEIGWSLDTRQLYIGNGLISEGAPSTGVTEILTQYSDLLSVGTTYTFEGLSSGVTIQTGPDSLHPIVRSLQSKLDDIVSVKDFGAVGDGVTDDTAAIQRALNNVYSTAQNVLLQYHHRTIYFPAGEYLVTSTINIPPYTRIQGEGKRTTIITGSFNGPVAQFADGFGQTGVTMGLPNPSTLAAPDYNEYHFSDIQFYQQYPSYTEPCLLIDGCWSSTFNRVMFRGLEGQDSNGNILYGTDYGIGAAGVALRNLSGTVGISNVVFNQCDFWEVNYGLELNNDTKGITINDCYFDNCYHYMVLNNNQVESGGQYFTPFGITISNNYFRYSYAEGILCYTGVTDVYTSGNFFTAWGLQDYESTNNVINTTGTAAYPAIVFNATGNFSVADTFEADTVNANVPLINDNGYPNYYVLEGTGVVNGRLTNTTGTTVTLANAASFTGAGLTNIPTNYTNLNVNYTLLHAGVRRTGTLTVSNSSGTFGINEEYTETGSYGSSQVVFRANTSTGNIEYTSASVGNAAVLTYNINYFTK